jgi:hypothetical protein
MLHEFEGTPYERDEGIHEESRGHRALHGVLCLELTTPRLRRGRAVQVLTTPRLRRGRAVLLLTTPWENRGRAVVVRTTPWQSRGRAAPSLGSGSECVGSSSECVTNCPAHIGMPRESVGILRERLESPSERRRTFTVKPKSRGDVPRTTHRRQRSAPSVPAPSRRFQRCRTPSRCRRARSGG